MNNSYSLILIIGIVLSSGLSCSFIGNAGGTSSAPDNRSVTDKAVDAAVGVEKIGIQECDEVVDLLNAEINNPNDDFVTKAVKATVLNKIKDEFKKALEQNQSNRKEMAEICGEFKKNLETYKAQQSN
jgi:hypothetical protein